MTAILEWDKSHGTYRSLPFYFVWEVWKGRNNLIFEGRPFHIHIIFSNITKWFADVTTPSIRITDGSIRNRPHEIVLPAIYFDGASVEGIMGCGVWIKLSQNERIHIFWNGGPGSNNKAEIMALWGGLYAASNLQLQNPHFYGDSRIVIDWITHRSVMQTPVLQGWSQRIQRIWHNMNCPPITHIYRESNTRADALSKRGVNAVFGDMHISQFQDGVQIWESTIPLP